MIALIDIGNSRAKYCLLSKGERGNVNVVDNEFLLTVLTVDILPQVKKLIVANVSQSQITAKINLLCQQNDVIFQQINSELKKNKLVSAYQNPKQLGVDRWLGLLAAAETFPQENILIVDAGTATTLDLLAANGQHKGGWIIAGVSMLVNSVLTNTAQVKANAQEDTSLAFGVNSSENLHYGAWAATAGAVTMAVQQSELQGMHIDKILLTGGNAHQLHTLLTNNCIVIEDLLFIGLQQYSEAE